MKGKENIFTFGEYPLVSLKEARLKRDEARKMIAGGVDPAVNRDMEKVRIDAPVFADIALEFLEKNQKESSSEKSRYAMEMRIRKYILPFLGNIQPDEITAPLILSVLRRLEGRGTLETAHRVNQIIGQIFRYGVATGRATRDPSADLRGALLRAIDGYTGSLTVREALRFSAYTFARPGNIRQAEWEEINFDNSEWSIPKEKMKMKRHILSHWRRKQPNFCGKCSSSRDMDGMFSPPPEHKAAAARCRTPLLLPRCGRWGIRMRK
jgi:integrase